MSKPEDKVVLVVDDEPNVRDYLGALLEDAGFQVQTAADGEEALEMIRRQRPDFISLDLVMPRKSGHRLLFELKRDRDLQRIPVIIVTAHAQDDLGQEDLAKILDNRVLSGPGVYLEKPVDPARYVETVKQALGISIESRPEEDPAALQQAVEKRLQGASPEALRNALRALKGK